MATTANLIIIQLLHTESSHAEFLRLCWDKLSPDQKREVFHFLYLGGQHRTFMGILKNEMNTEAPVIPWTHLFAIVSQMKRLETDTIRAFVDSASSSSEFGQFRVDHPDLVEMWHTTKQKRITTWEKRKGELMKELDFARQRGFKDQRARILADLKRYFPTDKEIAKVFQTEKEFQARQVLSKIFSKKHSYIDFKSDADAMGEKDLKEVMKKIKKLIKKKPFLALDMAVMFFQMEAYPEALKVLDMIKKKDFTALWHDLQISIEGKQFARALSVISLLKREKLSTDHSFSLLYFQALALFGLGETTQAKQIIRNINKIRPNFRSANSLLLEWENET